MTSIEGINSNLIRLMSDENKARTEKMTGSESFSYALDAAKKLIEENKTAEINTEQKTVDFMTGQSDNIVDLLVAQEKSNILLQYSLQVRNSLLSSYKEIMNLSI